MTELTQESLERLLMNLKKHIDEVGDRISVIPKYLIVPPAIFRTMMYRTPIKMAKGIRGRKRALYWRSKPPMWQFFGRPNK